MKQFLKSWLCLLIVAALVSCHSEVTNENEQNIPENENTPTEITVNVNLPEELQTRTDLTVNSFAEEVPVSEGSVVINSNYNDLPQILFITDREDNIVLMSKSCIGEDKKISMDIGSTAIALASLNPLFANVDSERYSEVERLISTTPSFSKLVDQVENTINSGVDLFDEGNTELFVELSNVWDEICNNVEPRSSDEVPLFTKANPILGINPDPVLVETEGLNVILRNKGLVPTYECQVYHGGVLKETRLIKTHGSYGFLDLFDSIYECEYGEPETFYLNAMGEYKFFLDRTTDEAIKDFSIRLWTDVLSMIGLYNCGSLLENTATIIGTIGPLLRNPDTEFKDVVKAMSGAVYSFALSNLNPEQLGKFMSKFCVAYNVIKGFANEMIRCYLGFAAPQYIDFCLCSYDGEVTSCTRTDLEKVSGDNQTGFGGQRLMLPLTVETTVYADDGTEIERSSYQKVKFEVVKGEGSVEQSIVGTESNSKLASTYWTLGESGDQQVKAVVIDMVTGVEISEPVYFTANLREEADLTIRLDWNKLSGNTDIDLHVTDPYGEEIAFYHMSSASGGWLDRDDVIGPGPEHICWTKAPSGAYLVQVHYYGSESHAVTNYSVTINCNKVNYGPYTGSIGYHQLVTIGVLNLPSGEFTRAGDNFNDYFNIRENVTYPAKSVWN